MTPDASVVLMVLIKKYTVVTLISIFGGLAHAIDAVKRKGWRGWTSFFGDIVVCVFFGQVFFQVAELVKPEYTALFTSLGSFWGVKSFEFLKTWIVTAIEANLIK